MNVWFQLQQALDALGRYSELVILALTAALVWSTVHYAASARRQADAVEKQLALQREPYLLVGGVLPDSSGWGVLNMGSLPAFVSATWLTDVSTGKELPLAFYGGRDPGVQAKNYLAPGQSERVEFQTEDIKVGTYTLHIAFRYPTYPNHTLYLDVPAVLTRRTALDLSQPGQDCERSQESLMRKPPAARQRSSARIGRD
jgi:hypothetical protein